MPSIEGEQDRGEPVVTRRAFLAGVGGVVGGAALMEWKATDVLTPPTPEELAADMTDALNRTGRAEGVKRAADYRLVYPTRELPRPDGIWNPVVLGDNTYGHIHYDAEGRAEVNVAPEGGELVPLAAEMEGKGPDHTPNPRIETVDISSVYIDQPGSKYYLAVVGDQPGRIPADHSSGIEVGSPLQIGK